jgi:uncharacterized membrane protein YjjP (DUF1212 family)
MDRSEIKHLAGTHTDLLLDIGSTLLASGATSERINRNVQRIGSQLGYDVDIFFDYTGLIITIQLKSDPTIYATRHKKLSKHHANFNILKDISLLSWKVKEDNLEVPEIEEALEEIKTEPTYSRWQILIAVGLACFALCFTAGGNLKSAGIAGLAGFTGMYVRQELEKRGYLSMIVIMGASFVSSMIASADAIFKIGDKPEITAATCVLYLIPGVQMINSVIDLIEGYYPMALARGVFSSYIILWIAVGITLSIMFIGLSNF